MEKHNKTFSSAFRHGYQPINDENDSQGQNSIQSSYYQVSVKPLDVDVTLGAETIPKEMKGLRNPWVIGGIAITTVLVLVSMATFSRNIGSDFAVWGKSPFDSTPPMSIFLDTTKNEYQVFDNSPLIPTSKQKYHVLASGKYLKNVNGNGWHYLEIETLHMDNWVKSNNATLATMTNTTRHRIINEEYVRSMKALGYLEGFVTCHEMNAWYMNFYSGLFDGGDPTEEALEFLESNHNWMSEQAERNYLANEYWLTVKGLLSQLEGVVAGAKDGCPGSEQTRGEDSWTTPTHGPGVFLPSLHKRPALIHLLLMNANGDLYQIGEKYDQANAPASTVLQNYPNDDDYNPDTDQTSNSTASTTVDQPTDSASTPATKQVNSVDVANDSTSTVNMHASASSVKHARRTRGPKTTLTIKDRMESLAAAAATATATAGAASASASATENEPRRRALRVKPEFVRRRTTLSSQEDDSTRWSREKYLAAKQRRLSSEAAAAKAKKSASKSTLSSTKRSLSFASTADDDATHPHQLNPIADRKHLHRHDHCSVLIKINDKKDDILFAHNTWDDFQNAAPRMIKHYHYNNYRTITTKPWSMFNVLFSSSPGLLSSVDDFFLIKGRGHMAVIETSIDVFNNQLLNLVIPESMLSWTRARLANQLAHSGKAWSEIFSLFHSGTYVNQWMVLDFKKFVNGSDPASGFLTVLEEVPGYIHFEDVTGTLVNTSYWASFNNPYFDDIARLTGQYQLCKENELNCYDHDPRGLIFQREQSSVQTIEDMKRMIGYNDFENDPLSLNDSCNAIACRQDLQPNSANRYPFGAIDGKVSSVRTAMMNNNRPMLYARLGPSPDNGHGPFCWDAFKEGKNHRGFSFFHVQHPDCFDFNWQIMPPVDMKPLLTFLNPAAPSTGSSNEHSGMRADNTLIYLDRCPEDSGNQL